MEEFMEVLMCGAALLLFLVYAVSLAKDLFFSQIKMMQVSSRS